MPMMSGSVCAASSRRRSSNRRNRLPSTCPRARCRRERRSRHCRQAATVSRQVPGRDDCGFRIEPRRPRDGPICRGAAGQGGCRRRGQGMAENPGPVLRCRARLCLGADRVGGGTESSARGVALVYVREGRAALGRTAGMAGTRRAAGSRLAHGAARDSAHATADG